LIPTLAGSLRETAETIGISESATKGRLFQAKKALRRSLIPKLKRIRHDSAAGFARYPQRNDSGEANTRTGQQQSTHKKEGDEHVSKAKETRKYRGPSNVRPSGNVRPFSCEPAA
jgi:hypothetical protein